MASINRNFGRLVDGALTYAPRSLVIDGREIWNPRAETYAVAGYLPVVEASPSDPPREGYHYAPDGWEECDGAIRRTWREEANPPPRPRVFSKMNLEAAVFKRGLLATLDAFVDAQTITNELGDTMPLRRAYNTAQTFREDHPLFAPYLAAAKQALGVDDETADAILAESVATEG